MNDQWAMCESESDWLSYALCGVLCAEYCCRTIKVSLHHVSNYDVGGRYNCLDLPIPINNFSCHAVTWQRVCSVPHISIGPRRKCI